MQKKVKRAINGKSGLTPAPADSGYAARAQARFARICNN
jgi:hypothetical protein